jgi:hypothetical protein
MDNYLEQIHAKNADTVTIMVRYNGEEQLHPKSIRRCDLDLYTVGSSWYDRKDSFTVVSQEVSK